MFKAATLVRRGATLCAVAVACTLSACSNSDSVMQPDTVFDDNEVPTQRADPPSVDEVDPGGGATPEPPQEAQDMPDMVTKGDTPHVERG